MTSDDISFMSENIMNLRWPRTVPATFQERATVTGSCTTRFHIEIRGDAFLANLSSASLSLCVFLLFGLWISGCISVANWERHEMFDLQENCGGYTVNRESTAVLQLIRRWRILMWWLMFFYRLWCDCFLRLHWQLTWTWTIQYKTVHRMTLTGI